MSSFCKPSGENFTKYENIKLMGCIVVLLTEDREFVEHRVGKKTINNFKLSLF